MRTKAGASLSVTKCGDNWKDNKPTSCLLPYLIPPSPCAPAAMPSANSYRIKAISADGLTSWGNSEAVTFENKLVIPNIITPNGDGQNEAFKIGNLHLYPNSQLRIYNRWGKEIYHSNNYQGNWKAENQSAGIYYYLLQTSNGESFKGWVEVVK